MHLGRNVTALVFLPSGGYSNVAANDAVSGNRAAMRGDAELPQSSGVGRFLRRRWWAILIPLVLVTGAALAFSLLQDKEYQAETSLLFRDTGPVLASAEPERWPRQRCALHRCCGNRAHLRSGSLPVLCPAFCIRSCTSAAPL